MPIYEAFNPALIMFFCSASRGIPIHIAQPRIHPAWMRG